MKTTLQKLISTPRSTESSFTPTNRISTGVVPSKPQLGGGIAGGPVGGRGGALAFETAQKGSHFLGKLLRTAGTISNGQLPRGSPMEQLSSKNASLASAFEKDPAALMAKLQNIPNLSEKLTRMADNFDRVASIVPPKVGSIFAKTADTLRAMAMYAPSGPRLPLLPPIG